MANITKDRARDALAFCRKIETVLKALPEKGQSEEYSEFIKRLKEATRNAEVLLVGVEPSCRIRTRSDGSSIHAFGFSADSASGFTDACRDYVGHVRAKCAETGQEV